MNDFAWNLLGKSLVSFGTQLSQEGIENYIRGCNFMFLVLKLIPIKGSDQFRGSEMCIFKRQYQSIKK
jgi:hypothetical protein